MRSLQQLSNSALFVPRNSFSFSTANSISGAKISVSNFRRKRDCRLQHRIVQVRAFDEDSFGISSFDNFGENDGATGYLILSSDGEDSDGDFVLNPVSDVDLPAARVSSNDALTVTAHRLAMVAQGHRRHRIRHGILNNLALISFLTALLLFVDWCAWKIVRIPLPPFYLSRPFFIATALASVGGYLCVPFLRALRIHQIVRKERPVRHSNKRAIPTMGGLFFIPIGIGVAKFIVGFSSIEVSAAAVATLAFAVIGLLDDILQLFKHHNNGLSTWIKLLLEIALGTSFAFWLDTTSISSPYSMKALVPLPAPLGLVFLGKFYLLLTSLCFVSMGSVIDITDSLDGLAGGTAALTFIGMSVAVLPICSELAIFGASMAGACVGFLFHNRYRASVLMGNTGSLALGAALAAMASCTGMFLPLCISSGIFVLEASSVLMQLAYFKASKCMLGTGQRLFRMAPFHHHLELCGFREPIIVAGAYIVSSLLALVAGYVGLISA